MTEPAPNWYPDPTDASRLRYWDGVAWTEHFAPRFQTASAGAPSGKTQTRLVNRRTGWTLVGVGLASWVAAGFLLITSIGPAAQDLFFSDPCATPCSHAFDFDEGRYVVFEQLGQSRSFGPAASTTQNAATITPHDVAVTSPTGRRLTVKALISTQTVDRNGTIYGGVVGFHVPDAGRYELSVDAPDQTRVIVAPGLGQTFLKATPGFATAVLGSLAALFGLVILLVARSRRAT